MVDIISIKEYLTQKQVYLKENFVQKVDMLWCRINKEHGSGSEGESRPVCHLEMLDVAGKPVIDPVTKQAKLFGQPHKGANHKQKAVSNVN